MFNPLEGLLLLSVLCPHFNADDRAACVEVLPCILHAVLRAREADALERLAGTVVFPPIDLAVFISIDLDAQDRRAVHVAECVELAIAV